MEINEVKDLVYAALIGQEKWLSPLEIRIVIFKSGGPPVVSLIVDALYELQTEMLVMKGVANTWKIMTPTDIVAAKTNKPKVRK